MISKMVSCKQYWSEIKTDYEMVWLELEKEKPKTEIAKEYRKIKQKEVKASEQETNLPQKNRLLWKCRNEVLKSRGLKSN